MPCPTKFLFEGALIWALLHKCSTVCKSSWGSSCMYFCSRIINLNPGIWSGCCKQNPAWWFKRGCIIHSLLSMSCNFPCWLNPCYKFKSTKARVVHVCLKPRLLLSHSIQVNLFQPNLLAEAFGILPLYSTIWFCKCLCRYSDRWVSG